MSNLSSSNVIRALFFFIQFLSRIMFLEIDLIYMIIHYCPFGVLSSSSVHSPKMTFSFVTVLISVSYLTEMIFSSFSQIHVFDITVILILESISPSFVVVLSSLFRIVIGKVIRFPNSNSLSFLRLSRFSTYRRLRKWSSFV